MFGIGMGLLFVAAAPLPNQWFNKRRALAMGICAAGSGVGGVLFSICTNLMIENISLVWAFRITAFCIFFVNSIVILVLKDRIKIISARYRSFDVSLLRNLGFVSVILWGFLMLFGYVSVMYSLSDFAVSIGLTQQQGSVITGMFSAGVMIGRPTMGFLGDTIGRINLSIICTIGTALTCFFIWMFATSYRVMIFFALIHGMLRKKVLISGAMSGVFWTMSTPVAAEVVGLQDLASALSLLWLLGTVIPTTRISHLSTVLVDIDSCRSNRPAIKTECHFRRENRDRYISTYHWLCRCNDPRRRSCINCLISSLKL